MKISFIFPGQGSQYVGMGRDLCDKYPEAGKIFQLADEILGFPISNLCFEGPAEKLQQTFNAQPAILTVSAAWLDVLRRFSVEPSAVAGHSLGEYTALYASGAISFEDAIRIVRKRGQYMQEAVPLGIGGMVAVLGLEPRILQDVCKRVSSVGVVEVVNMNCPGQVVMAGQKAALEEASLLAKEAGAKRCIQLPVSAPFHSSLMKPAGDRLSAVLDGVTFGSLKVPVVSNVTADYIKVGDEARRLLVKQTYSPVRWEESMRRLIKDGFDVFVEVGPGNVLTGLQKKIDRGVQALSVEDEGMREKILACGKEVG